jgi:hypothetical protein
VCYDECVARRDDPVTPEAARPAETEAFERAKWPMVIAAVGVAGGLAIAGSIERTAGGAIVLGAWVVGVAALHRLGRAGSTPRPPDDI